MAKNVKINLKKYHRALLSEVLPFELPIIYNNDGFFAAYENKDKAELIYSLYRKIFSDKNFKSTIPYSYKIYKTENSVRYISIPHPMLQIRACKFLEKYDSVLIKILSKGKQTSLRYPTKISSTVYKNNKLEKKYKFKSGQIIENNDDNLTKYYISYFSYNYSRLYQYYNSNEFLYLEKRFKYLWTTDISNCFDSIYTHTISWAITKNKDYAKSHKINASIFNDFDKLMQHSNHDETNGILIGWEISRLFSEIILQEVDRQVISQLKSKNIIFDKDYCLKRYVDDYFLYSNDLYKLETIYSVLSDVLHKFKLNLNTNKSLKLVRPFITPQSRAVESLFSLLDTFKDDVYKEKKFFSIGNKINNLLRNIKIIAKSEDANYSNIINLAVNKICNDALGMLEPENKFHEKDNFLNNILLYIKLSGYLISIAPHIRACNKFILLCQQSLEFSSNHDLSRADDFKNEIFLLLRELSKSTIYSANEACLNNINFFISLTMFHDMHKLSENEILDIFGYEKFDDIRCLSHFEITSILFYIKQKKKNEEDLYKNIRSKIEDIIKGKIDKIGDNKELLLIDTEQILLILDCLSCPYIDIPVRKEIAKFLNKLFGYTTNNEIMRMSDFDFEKNFQYSWFVNWSNWSFLRTLVKQQLYFKNKMVYNSSAI